MLNHPTSEAHADDAALLAAAARGDEAAFAQLVDRHASAVLAVCRRHVASEEAEDAAQEALVKAWRHAGSFEGRSSVRTWLYRIAVNAARDRQRRLARRPTTAGDITELAEQLSDPVSLDERLAARGLDPALRKALTALPHAHREVVVLCDVAGWPLADVAERQGVAVGTIKSRRHRAHAQLADALAAPAAGAVQSGAEETEPPSDSSNR